MERIRQTKIQRGSQILEPGGVSAFAHVHVDLLNSFQRVADDDFIKKNHMSSPFTPNGSYKEASVIFKLAATALPSEVGLVLIFLRLY